MKFITFLIASFLASSCIAQETTTKPSLSLVQAAQIAQATLEANGLGVNFYLRAIELTTRQDKPTEAIYEARFEPPEQSETKTEGESSVIRYRVIVVDMHGKGTVEDREFTRRVIRRRVMP